MGGFQGPLAGMASALEAAATEFVLFVPCDSPLVVASLGPRLHAALAERGADIAVAHDGKRMHPVFVLVRRTVRSGLVDFLARGERKIDRWFAEEKTAVVDFSDLPDMFLNVNREDDRSRLEARLAARPGDGSAAAGRNPKRRRPPVVGFAGYSGSGKTTLATAVVRALTEAGVRVAAVKHAHHEFDIDRPGKDSYELRRAGAVQTLIGSRRRWALVTETDLRREPTLDELVDRLDWKSVDIVLVEGFKHAEVRKIAVGRGAETPLVDDPFVVAVATPRAEGSAGAAADTGAPALPRLDLDRPDQVARLHRRTLPDPVRLHPMRNALGTAAPVSNPDPSCMDDFDPSSLLVEQALQHIQALAAPVSGTERVAVRETLGRVLAEPVVSAIDVPAHDNSAMDGYAVRAADAGGDEPVVLRMVGTAWAGKPFPGPVGSRECVRIMTGAVMPPGTDAVVIQEKAETGPGDSIRLDDRPRAG